ncbi:MAG: hypothetical protein P4L84_04080 [Isosphaeraceae bacterium]|nr:hypothetical protein [Isosphaeraceae bacterium]
MPGIVDQQFLAPFHVLSLIYTCQLNQAGPFDYLTQLQQHADALSVRPERWMPWNYRDAVA